MLQKLSPVSAIEMFCPDADRAECFKALKTNLIGYVLDDVHLVVEMN